MDNTKTKFLASPLILFGVLFICILSYFQFILIFYILPKSNLENASKGTLIAFAIILGGFPTLTLMFTLNKCFSMISFDEEGVHRSLFNRFFKKDFLWEDIKELRIFNRVDQWLFISKLSTEGMSYYQLIKNKDIIQISFTPNILKAIRKYSSVKIENLNENQNNTI
ncbi:MAG: hypothetical protein K8Q99_02935 [Acholeplasmataceae bacterium]|nr:hypothetical protein [Acholeplasmataceae bacterium]